MRHLYSTCLLADGFHWLRIAVGGEILERSQCGFETVADALRDFLDRFER